MDATPLQVVAGRIEKDWAHKPEMRSLCLSIVEFVVRPPRKAFLTFSMIRRGIGADFAPERFASAIEYLLGDIDVLELVFEMTGEDDFPVRITAQDVAEAQARGINPITGDYDPDICGKIFSYFQPAGALNLA